MTVKTAHALWTIVHTIGGLGMILWALYRIHPIACHLAAGGVWLWWGIHSARAWNKKYDSQGAVESQMKGE